LRLIVSEGQWPISTMNDTNDSPKDEEQLMTPVSDYRALLETTRPLVIAKSRVSSARLSIYRDQATSLETGDCYAEFVLKRGEIVDPDFPGQTIMDDEGPVKAAALSHTSSNLTIKIHIGMS
jgi:hypothetical protein